MLHNVCLTLAAVAISPEKQSQNEVINFNDTTIVIWRRDSDVPAERVRLTARSSIMEETIGRLVKRTMPARLSARHVWYVHNKQNKKVTHEKCHTSSDVTERPVTP